MLWGDCGNRFPRKRQRQAQKSGKVHQGYHVLSVGQPGGALRSSLPAAALLIIISKTQNLWMAGTIATVGAVLGDLVPFGLFRSAKRFADHHGPPQERYARWWNAIKGRIPPPWQPVALVALVLAFLVLPLQNEFADFLLARIRRVRTSAVVIISYVGNGIGLYAIAWLARFGWLRARVRR